MCSDLEYALLEVGHAVRVVPRPLPPARLVRSRGRGRVRARARVSAAG